MWMVCLTTQMTYIFFHNWLSLGWLVWRHWKSRKQNSNCMEFPKAFRNMAWNEWCELKVPHDKNNSNRLLSWMSHMLSVKGSGSKLYRYQLPHLYILIRDTTTVIQHVLLNTNPWTFIGWHAQAVMCFRLCLCSSQRGGSPSLCLFFFLFRWQAKKPETYRILGFCWTEAQKIFLLEKKSNVLENKLTTDPNFDYGGRQRSWVGDFIHLTFGCPEMLNTTDFLGLFFMLL